MESLGQILKNMKNPVLSPSTAECWCGGIGGKDRATIPIFGSYKEEQWVFRTCCVCEVGVRESERKAQLKKEYQVWKDRRYIAEAWARSNIPARFFEFRLSTSPLAKSSPELIRRLTFPLREDASQEEWDAWYPRMDAWQGSWYFYGGYGVGKTGLAVSLAHEFLRGGFDLAYQLRFVSLPYLLGELRSTYNNRKDDSPTEQDIIAQYANTALLILDDLGAEQVTGSGWVEDRLYQIIGQRHDEQRLTIFTSNLSLAQLAKRIGERITWRILEMCGPDRIVEIKGPNLRDIKNLPG